MLSVWHRRAPVRPLLSLYRYYIKLSQGKRGQLRALVISPTRELAEQICDAFTDLGQKTGLRNVAIYGGVGKEMQIRKLRNGAEIAEVVPDVYWTICTPGVLNLSHLEILVIDEADRMFDMGFLPDIKRILECILQPRQTLLFSATMPDDIRRLVKEVLRNPVTVQIGGPLRGIGFARVVSGAAKS